MAIDKNKIFVGVFGLAQSAKSRNTNIIEQKNFK
jgi:hypothetical protein